MTDKVYQMVYRSSAQDGFDPAELTKILEASNRNNPTKNITGMLFYKKDIFFQMLEGDKAAIDALYRQKILKDPRHINAKVYWEGYADQRSFANWSMAFADLSKLNSEDVARYGNIINQAFDPGNQDGSLGYKLFMKYKEIFKNKL